MSFHFDGEKTIQTLSCLLDELGTDRINIVKALKLLYLVDREALSEGFPPITGDTPFAMKHGPVLSRTYDLMKLPENWPDPPDEEEMLGRYFRREGHDLVRSCRTDTDRLSEFDRRMIKTVASKFGHMGEWDLRDLTHELPEWVKNQQGNTSVPIPLRDILEAVGRSDCADVLEQEAREDAYFASLFRA